MGLPLFRLPVLVIKLILETMGFIEIFVLISTSSRTKRIFKNLVTIRDHQMILLLKKTGIRFYFRKQSETHLGVGIYVFPQESQPDDNVFLLRIGSNEHVPSKIFIFDGKIILRIFWDTNVLMGTELYNALSEVFRIPVDEFCMKFDNFEFATIESWIGWNNDLFHDIGSLHIVGKCNFSHYVWMLKNIRTRNELYFHVEPHEYPNNPENIVFLNIGASNISILHGRWINTQMLNSLEAHGISIWRVAFTDSEINVFLRNWTASEVPSNWQNLKIRFDREPDPEIVLEQINATVEDLMKPNDALRQWSFNSNNGEKCTMIYAFYQDEFHNQYHGFEFHVEK